LAVGKIKGFAHQNSVEPLNSDRQTLKKKGCVIIVILTTSSSKLVICTAVTRWQAVIVSVLCTHHFCTHLTENNKASCYQLVVLLD